MKKLLLTGGSGFIGKNILESFLAEKYEIIAPTSSELNLTDTACVDDFFEGKEFDVVLHTGTKPAHRNAKDLANLFYSNLRMFQNLERHKYRYGKFINFGSGAVYDISQNITDAREENICQNIGSDDHGFCKYVVSKQISALDNFVDLNIFGIFGKYEDWQIRFISNAICKVLYDLPITLRQNRRFSYLYVDDLMPILEFFIENEVEHKSYNIVPNQKVELLEVANLVREVSGKEVEIRAAQEGFGLDYTGDNSRLRGEFEGKFTPIEEAIHKLYEYYEDNKSLIDRSLLLADK